MRAAQLRAVELALETRRRERDSATTCAPRSRATTATTAARRWAARLAGVAARRVEADGTRGPAAGAGRTGPAGEGRASCEQASQALRDASARRRSREPASARTSSRRAGCSPTCSTGTGARRRRAWWEYLPAARAAGRGAARRAAGDRGPRVRRARRGRHARRPASRQARSSTATAIRAQEMEIREDDELKLQDGASVRRGRGASIGERGRSTSRRAGARGRPSVSGVRARRRVDRTRCSKARCMRLAERGARTASASVRPRSAVPARRRGCRRPAVRAARRTRSPPDFAIRIATDLDRTHAGDSGAAGRGQDLHRRADDLRAGREAGKRVGVTATATR